jgi:hypothetical protein
LPSSPLPPQRYRALRARYSALLLTLYERTSLTLREIAAAAGRTERDVQMQVRALGCQPRNARTCRPGTNVGVRRAGPKPAPLNAPAARRTVEAFAQAARELAASTEARVTFDLQRATARAAQRTAHTKTRVIRGAARSLTRVAAAMEDMAAVEQALAAGPKRTRARKAAGAPPPSRRAASRADRRDAQERLLREQEERMWQAHRAKAERAAAPPASDEDGDRRINEIAARYDGGAGPRIRGL